MHTAFCIADGRTCFYQWDVNQQMLVADETIKELHFCNGTSECSLVCKVEDGKADVPNILLQSARSISVYGYTGDHTKIQKIFRVNPRTKPEDYVYTETEVKRYEALEKRVDALEKVEPPAPYVLPTASTEVKGGVKVGNGLRMDGDALGVVPDGEYELIETITLGEDTSVIERTQEPDGTQLALNTIFISAAATPLKAAPANQYALAYVGDEKNHYYEQIHLPEILGITERRAWGMLLIANGFFVPLYGRAQSYSPTPAYTTNTGIKPAKVIKRIYIKTTNGNDVFPAGTVIKIWGVRADA